MVTLEETILPSRGNRQTDTYFDVRIKSKEFTISVFAIILGRFLVRCEPKTDILIGFVFISLDLEQESSIAESYDEPCRV